MELKPKERETKGVPAGRRQKFSPNGRNLVISLCKSKAKCRRQPSRPSPGTLEPGAYYRNYRTGISGGSLRPAPPPPYPPPGGGSVPLIPLIFCSNNFFPGHAGPWPAPPPPYPPPLGGSVPLIPLIFCSNNFFSAGPSRPVARAAAALPPPLGGVRTPYLLRYELYEERSRLQGPRQPALAGRPNGVKWRKRIKTEKRETEGLRPETRKYTKSQLVTKSENEKKW